VNMRHTTRFIAAAALTVIPLAAVTRSEPATAASCTRVADDFNGDGHADAVVGSPHRNLAGHAAAGAINIVYGATTGLTTAGNQYLDPNSFGALNTATTSDSFGRAVATGYLNNDCYADLVVAESDGSPGALIIIDGTATGLDPTTATKISAAQIEPATPAAGDAVGTSLAVGDYNGDGHNDLAVSVIGYQNHTGALSVLYGNADGTGLTTTSNSWITEPDLGLTPHGGDEFGHTLAAGDFNGDSITDLAVGQPSANPGGLTDAGTVTTLSGTPDGLTSAGATIWSQNSPGVPGANETYDQFGYALAAGDITGDGITDLAVAAPGESLGSTANAGAVTTLTGTHTGLTATGSHTWSQNSAGIPGTAEYADGLGNALAIGDLNGDGHGDLAIGVQHEAVGSVYQAGALNVIYGSPTGLTATGAQLWSQNTAGILGTSETNDGYGATLHAAAITGTSHTALLIGITGESSAGGTENGAAATLLGTASGLAATGNQFIDAHNLANGAQDRSYWSTTLD
jgi:FG-GAP repeat